MGRIVVVSGCDGSGKTTVIRILSSYLSRRHRVSIHWLRGSHLHMSIIYRVLSRLRTFRGYDNPYYKVSVPATAKTLFVFLEFTGFLPHLFARWLRKYLNDFVLCDRGTLDFLIWVMTTLRYPRFLRTILGRSLFKLSLKESPVVLTAELNILRARSDVPINFLSREYLYYSILQKYVAGSIIDTSNKKPTRVVAEVLRGIGVEDT
jgi:energy-coupling factor transporter ATP-binding protein EcfA2